MGEIRRAAAQSVSQFVGIVEGLTPTTASGLWFRGQSNAGHRLVPSALRAFKRVTDHIGRPIEELAVTSDRGGYMDGPRPERMLAAFKRQARPFLDPLPENDFEWMFVAQHHGVPTRLLDWTTNALVALYFAVNDALFKEGDGALACRQFLDPESHEFREDGFAVFVIDPGAINNHAHEVAEPLDIAEHVADWNAYLSPMASRFKAYMPICVLAPHVSPRIRAQSGVFTLHGSNVWPLDYYDALRPLITKIFIPYAATMEIREGLSRLGMTEGFIYPGLDSIARDVKMSERLRYDAEDRRS